MVTNIGHKIKIHGDLRDTIYNDEYNQLILFMTVDSLVRYMSRTVRPLT